MKLGIDSLQEIYESEVIEIMSMIEDPMISSSLFRKRMVSLLCSNIKLYHELFGAEFIGWLKWMQSTNHDRFKRLMAKTSLWAEAQHIQFLQRFCNYGISAELGAYLTEQVRISNLNFHFVSGPLLPNRIEVFIENACKFAGRWSMELGFCPIFNLAASEYYPMSLFSIVKMAFQGFPREPSTDLLLGYSAECNAKMILLLVPGRFNPDPQLLRVQMGPYFGTCVIDSLKLVRPFIAPELRPFVYHYQFATNPIIMECLDGDRPNSQYANDIRLEVLISIFISQLMSTYLDTVLRQLEGNSPVDDKLKMWSLIEYQMLDLLKTKAKMS